MYLGIEAHFQLWQKYFCLIPQTRGESIHEFGGAVVWKIAGQGYPEGTPKEDLGFWTSKWFYIHDVSLCDPTRQGLPKYSSEPPIKRYNWRPKGGEESPQVATLASQVWKLSE
jgi:hypothetical protein